MALRNKIFDQAFNLFRLLIGLDFEANNIFSGYFLEREGEVVTVSHLDDLLFSKRLYLGRRTFDTAKKSLPLFSKRRRTRAADFLDF